jgi:hypothetical protein
MQREIWPFALIVLFAVFSMTVPATAQEAEPTEEAEPGAEAEAAPEPAEPAEAAEAVEAEPAAEPAGTEFTQTVKFSPLSQTSLDGAAGEIDLRTVEFEVAGAKGGGITGAFSSGDADMQAIITTRLGCATTADTKVKFDMLIEFLDQDGQVIDRTGAKESLKNNDKVFNIKHTTLRWAVDYIDQARITVTIKD